MVTCVDFAISKDWRISKWGAEMQSASKYADPEVVGRNVMDLFTEDAHDFLTEKLQQAGQGKSSQYFRITFFTKVAEELDVFMYAHRGATSGADADITILGGVIPSTSPNPFCYMPLAISLDKEGNVTSWDDMAEAVTGMSFKVARGRKFVEYFMTEDFGAKSFLAEKISRTMAGEHVGTFMVPIFTIGAVFKIVELSACLAGDGGVVLSSAPTALKASIGELSRELGAAKTGDSLTTTYPSSELPYFAMSASDLPVLDSKI